MLLPEPGTANKRCTNLISLDRTLGLLCTFISILLASLTIVSFTASAQATGDYSVSWETNFSTPEQDDNGWSMITPSTDSRLIYVSASEGNDSSANIYSLSDSEIGPDPQNPVGPIQAFASIDGAMDQARTGFPDWVLLRRGDAWTNVDVLDAKAGSSSEERSVITYYGAAKQRPQIQTGNGAGIRFRYGDANYAALIGIHFYAQGRDPNSSDFVGFSNVSSSQGIEIIEANNDSRTILIEDCHFDFYAVNTAQRTNNGSGTMTDIVFRRNIFTNNYDVDAHSQGLYANNSSVLLEENLFDHNGWFTQSSGSGQTSDGGQATIYNHNTYFVNQTNTIFRRNIFLRSSSIQNKFTANPGGSADSIRTSNILVDNNFYSEGEIAISMGGNTDNNTGPRWQNIHLVNNVISNIGQSRPTNRNLGWGFGINDWSGGVVIGNLFTGWGSSGSVSNTFGIRISGHTSELSLENNRLYNIQGSGGSGRNMVVVETGNTQNISFSDNELQQPLSNSVGLIELTGTNDPEFSDNAYYSVQSELDWFTTNDWSTSLQEWLGVSGESATSSSQIVYSDPTRTLESYLTSIGQASSIDNFVTAATSESSASWTGLYTALELNEYIRQGFCAAPENCEQSEDPGTPSPPSSPQWSGFQVIEVSD